MTEQNGKKRWRDMTTEEKIKQREDELKALKMQARKENRKARDHRMYCVAGEFENLIHERIGKDVFPGGVNGGQYDKELLTEAQLKEQLMNYMKQIIGNDNSQSGQGLTEKERLYIELGKLIEQQTEIKITSNVSQNDIYRAACTLSRKIGPQNKNFPLFDWDWTENTKENDI